MVHLPYSIEMVKFCLFGRMRFVLNLQILRRVSLRMRFIVNLSFLNKQLVQTFRIPPPMESGSNFLHVLRIPYLLEKGGGIYHLGTLIMKVPGSKGVGMKEFLDDISKLKRMYSYTLHRKLRN